MYICMLADLRDSEGSHQLEEDHVWAVANLRLDCVQLHHAVRHFGIVAHETGFVLEVIAVKVDHGEQLGVDVGVRVSGYHFVLALQ